MDVVQGQAMGFESESNTCKLDLQVDPQSFIARISDYRDNHFDLKKGVYLEVKPSNPYVTPAMDFNNPQVHPTFEVVKPPPIVEFVSDPVLFTRGDDFCRLNNKLKEYLNFIYDKEPTRMLDKFFLDHKVKFKPIAAGPVSQSLQITYSFPYVQSWYALTNLFKFLDQRGADTTTKIQNNNQRPNPRFATRGTLPILKSVIQFLDQGDASFKKLSPPTKYFLFQVFNYFLAGMDASSKCDLPNFAKSVTGHMLTRSNMVDLVNFGNQNSIKNQLKLVNNNPAQAVLDGFKRFAQTLGRTPCQDDANNNILYFAKKYDADAQNPKNFPFTANHYLTELLKDNNPVDLFATQQNAPEFDHSFSKLPLVLGGVETVVFELRSLEQFLYDPTQQDSLREFATLLPSYFSIGKSILASKYDTQQIDFGMKMCHNGRIVNYDATISFAKNGDGTAQQEQVSQQQIHQQREEKRAILNAAADIRKERRQEQANNNVKSLYYYEEDDEAAQTLENEEQNISLIREERRKVRAQKRLDREKRREKEQQTHTSQVPTEAQVRRESLRLAREKKRLAREEERDVAAGVKPVTEQDLKQIIQQQEEKKKQEQQQSSMKHVGGITHQVVKNGNGVNVNIKLRFYD
ncbi:hypothetical protein C9374_012367 [Naegleria lovaniensis]|uniref:Uncharacterized protein n=1 Tax=Naegleria lovaniensis TaxID=51637 RepID=A0AA88KDV2_NAELO|nr:uncharacterized protein C9374_012367 [Naegleria lovaniensis]KAG2373264.1 hypothetical protein C9374_012367 [Naegleria lovaniensis]